MLKQIKERRSHFLKEFNGSVAPDTLIDTLLEAANWAPSHKLTLPFRFVVFRNTKLPELTAAISQSYQHQQEVPDQSKLDKIQSWNNKVSHAIALILKPSNKIPLWEEHAALGAAIQNCYLMLGEQDSFGGYWTSGNETNAPKMREFLKLQPHEIHCGYFLIGGIDVKRTLAQRPDVDVIWS